MSLSIDFEKKLVKKIKSTRSHKKLFQLPLELLYKYNLDLSKASYYANKIKILLLCSPCNGFGDIVFAFKLKKYIKTWYGNLVDIKIATSGVRQFIGIGEDIDDLIFLKAPKDNNDATNLECNKFNKLQAFDAREFMNLVATKGDLNNVTKRVDLESYDLYFVAPLTADFVPDFNEIHKLIKNSNRFNTFFFGEYNSPIHPDLLFNVGLGKGRLGLFFVDTPENVEKLPGLDYPYSIIYLGKSEGDKHLDSCYRGFIELLTKKHQLPRLDIVCQMWLKDEIVEDIDYFADHVNEYYKQIKLVYKKDGNVITETVFNEGPGPELVLRFDVLPLAFEKMQSLYKYALPTVVLTGDQSITDYLSCCHQESQPFYQGLSWKQDFRVNLSKLIPHKYLNTIKTTCGTINAINYKPKFNRFVKSWDFRVRAKKLMDAVILSALLDDQHYLRYKKAVLESKKVTVVKKKLGIK